MCIRDSACIDQPVTLAAGERRLIPTGIAIALPSADYVALVFARSGLGIKQGVCLSNGVGVIDSDYRGEIGVGLVNLGGEAYTVQPADRIAQLMVTPVVQPTVVPADTLELANPHRYRVRSLPATGALLRAEDEGEQMSLL